LREVRLIPCHLTLPSSAPPLPKPKGSCAVLVMASLTGGASVGVLTYDEFIAIRETQDKALLREFTNVHTRIDDVEARFDTQFDAVHTRIDTLEARFDARFDAVDARIDHLRDDVTQIKIGVQRSEASAYNARLRNSFREIIPIPVYNLETGQIQTPEIRPMNAKQFFRLRELSSDADKKLLHYLVDFYDLGVLDDGTGGSNSGTGSSGEESDTARRSFKPDKRVPINPHMAVERLARIHGLDEDNFVDLQHRPNPFAREVPPPTAPKRPAEPPRDRPAKRVELPGAFAQILPLETIWTERSTPSSKSESLDQERVRWGTPSEVRHKRLLRMMGVAETDQDPGEGAEAKGTQHGTAALGERRRTNLRINLDSPPRESIPAEESPAILDRESHKPSTPPGHQPTDPRPEEGSPTNPSSSSCPAQ